MAIDAGCAMISRSMNVDLNTGGAHVLPAMEQPAAVDSSTAQAMAALRSGDIDDALYFARRVEAEERRWVARCAGEAMRGAL